MRTILKYFIVIVLLLLSLPAILLASIIVGIVLVADWLDDVVGASLEG